MAFRGNRRQQRFPPSGQGKGDRYRNEHDDRGHGGNHGKNNYDDFSNYRGNNRNNRMPDGHWRGGGDRDRRGFRGQRNRQGFRGEDGQGRPNRQNMFKNKKRNRQQQQHYQYNAGDNMGWSKITIKDAGPLDKDEVMFAIRNLVEHPFTPIMYEPEGNNRVFYVEDNIPAAKAIQDLSRRVSLPSGRKLTIMTNRSPPPIRALSADQLEKITVVMSERYCVELKRLDMKKFHNDANLVKAEIFCPLNRIANMKVVVDVIVNHIPQVEEIDFSSNKVYNLEETNRLVGACPNLKRLNLGQNKINNIDALNKVTGLSLLDLTLEGNPLCDKFRDTESYISAVRKRFSKVIYLDGQELPKPIGFEVDDEDPSKLPKAVTSYFAVPGVRDLVLKFIEQYYQIYDTEDRTPLGAAYTEDASFTLTCTFPESGPGSRCTNIYTNESRNLKKLNNSEKRYQNLIKGRENIVSLLCKFPITTHDPESFTVDVPVAESNLINITLTGVFRQLSDRAPLVRSFSRTFIVIPQGAGYCICNEQLFITNATVEQIKKSFKNAPAATAETSGMVAQTPASASQNLTSEQEALILKFCEASGMLPEYSRMCLEQNNWDFTKAGELFTQLKSESKIPPNYFAQSL